MPGAASTGGSGASSFEVFITVNTNLLRLMLPEIAGVTGSHRHTFFVMPDLIRHPSNKNHIS